MAQYQGNYYHTKRTVFIPTVATRKQNMVATPAGWQYYTKYNPRYVPAIVYEIDICPKCVWCDDWLLAVAYWR